MTTEQIAADYQQGKDCLFGRDFKKAAEFFQKAADQGHAEAQYGLAGLYGVGNGVPHNKKLSFHWFRKSAEQGYVESQFSLGSIYLEGDMVERSVSKAVDWWHKAAEKNHSGAQFNLGSIYLEGKILKQDKIEAYVWLSAALASAAPFAEIQSVLGGREKDIALSLSLLEEDLTRNELSQAKEQLEIFFKRQKAKLILRQGIRFYHGLGQTQSYEKAVECFHQSAELGNMTAKFFLGCCYSKGYGVEQDDEKAFEWHEKSANGGCPESQVVLGDCYLEAIHVEQDYQKSDEWYRKAAEQGYAEAQYHLGCAYYGLDMREDGEGVKVDDFKAFEWWFKSAEQGNIDAIGMLKNFTNPNYFRRNVQAYGEENNAKKFDWLPNAAEQGYPIAQLNLGLLYIEGDGITKDEKIGVEWVRKAAEQGFVQAQGVMGHVYGEGVGVEKDEKEAQKWGRKYTEGLTLKHILNKKD